MKKTYSTYVMVMLAKVTIVTLALAFGLAVVGCDDGSGGGNTDPKTLVITGIPAEVYGYASSGGQIGGIGEIGIFPVGTTAEQALNWTRIVAGANLHDADVSSSSGSYTITIPLYNITMVIVIGGPETGPMMYMWLLVKAVEHVTIKPVL
jgi:hypothetical protein